jgi:hypothetical protein
MCAAHGAQTRGRAIGSRVASGCRGEERRCTRQPHRQSNRKEAERPHDDNFSGRQISRFLGPRPRGVLRVPVRGGQRVSTLTKSIVGVTFATPRGESAPNRLCLEARGSKRARGSAKSPVGGFKFTAARSPSRPAGPPPLRARTTAPPAPARAPSGRRRPLTLPGHASACSRPAPRGPIRGPTPRDDPPDP